MSFRVRGKTGNTQVFPTTFRDSCRSRVTNKDYLPLYASIRESCARGSPIGIIVARGESIHRDVNAPPVSVLKLGVPEQTGGFFGGFNIWKNAENNVEW